MNNMPTSSPTPLSPTIKIIQLNCNKKGSTVHGLLNTCFNDTDLHLLQESWWAQISPNGIKGLVGHRAWTPILPTTTQSTDNLPPCVMAYFQPRPGMEVVLRSDLIQDQNIQILNIIHQGNPTTTIINLYNNHKRHNECATVLLHTIPLSHNQQSSQVTGTCTTIYGPPLQMSTPVGKQTAWWTGSWFMAIYFQIPLANIPTFLTLLEELSQSSISPSQMAQLLNTQSHLIGQSNQSLPLTPTI